MGNKGTQIESSVPVDVETSIQKKIGSLPCPFKKSKCSIYTVPNFIRKQKELCYRPSVISIGPVYHKDKTLQTMQGLKCICLKTFLQLPDNSCRGSLERYISIVRELIGEIRDCYQDQPKTIAFGDDEFIELIVFDAIFLLHELLIPGGQSRNTIPKDLKVLRHYVRRDIFLLENQIPFFVLRRLFDVSFPVARISLVNHIRGYIDSWDGIPTVPQTAFVGDVSTIAHLVDFWWKCCCLPHNAHVVTNDKGAKFPKTAKELNDAGVKFKASKSTNPLSITFDSNSGELQIPKLTIYDNTESALRSVLFFEQCHYFGESHNYFTDMVCFLDELIDSLDDIQILQQNEILDNQLGSDEEAVNLFNEITKNLTFTERYIYSSTSEEVNDYANKKFNRWIAILRRDYFNHPWAIASFVFAIILFILTVLQTITGFIRN